MRTGASASLDGGAQPLLFDEAGLRRSACLHRDYAGFTFRRPQEAGRARGLHSERARGVCVGRSGVRGRHRREHHADARPRQGARRRGYGLTADVRITGLF